jgi:hypothetical protein
MFADIGGDEWTRFALTTAADQARFLSALDATLQTP